jgi:hypothetical protein
VRPLRLTATRRHRRGTRSRTRERGAAIAALVLAASVALVASSVARAHDATDALPTGAPEARLPIPRRAPAPVALLYIDRHCPLCQRSARLLDSLSATLDVPTLLLTNDAPDAVRRYSASLGLHQPVTLDSGGALAHSAHLRAVPALIMVDNGRQVGDVIYGTPNAATLATDLRAIKEHDAERQP